MFASETLASLLLMASGFLIARGLPVHEFGAFTAAVALASMLAIAGDSGMGMLAARDIAKGTSEGLAALDQLFTWRLLVLAVILLITPLLAALFLPTTEARRLALTLTPAVLLQSLIDFFCWVFKGAQRARLCAALQISSRLFLLFGLLIAVRQPARLSAIQWVYGIVNASIALLGLLLLRNSLHTLRLRRPSRAFFAHVVPSLYRLGAILILGVVFSRIDVMMVARLRGEADAGLYSAASRVLDGVRLLPMIAYSVFLPIFSALHAQPEALRPKFVAAYEALLFVGIAIALIGASFGQPLLVLLLGAPYAAADACLRPILWSAVPLCINILMFALLYALGDHHTPLVGIAVAVGVDVLLNLLWLPHGGIVAAGWIRVVADGLNGLILARGILKKGVLGIGSLFVWPAAVVATSFALVVLLKDQPALLRLLCPLSVCLALALFRLPRDRGVPA